MEEREEPWYDEDWGTKAVQQRIVRTMIDNEDDSRLNYHHNGQGVYAVLNRDALNGWGVPRGYAIHPGASPVHLTNLESKRTHHNAEWAKQSLAVTRQRNNERYSSTLWNMNLPGQQSFLSFIRLIPRQASRRSTSASTLTRRVWVCAFRLVCRAKHLKIDQEDLVLWLNLGTHHIVRSEDSPHTLTNLATSSVLLSPFNYHDWDVSMEVGNSVILNAPEPGHPWEISGIVRRAFTPDTYSDHT
jgi:primary-amine oxidase